MCPCVWGKAALESLQSRGIPVIALVRLALHLAQVTRRLCDMVGNWLQLERSGETDFKIIHWFQCGWIQRSEQRQGHWNKHVALWMAINNLHYHCEYLCHV